MCGTWVQFPGLSPFSLIISANYWIYSWLKLSGHTWAIKHLEFDSAVPSWIAGGFVSRDMHKSQTNSSFPLITYDYFIFKYIKIPSNNSFKKKSNGELQCEIIKMCTLLREKVMHLLLQLSIYIYFLKTVNFKCSTRITKLRIRPRILLKKQLTYILWKLIRGNIDLYTIDIKLLRCTLLTERWCSSKRIVVEKYFTSSSASFSVYFTSGPEVIEM